MSLHPLLADAFDNGFIEHSGRRHELRANISLAACELLYRQIAATGATVAVEVGMAYGVATLAIADALRKNTPTPALVSIDPAQHSGWDGVALAQLKRADFDFCEFIEEPSHLALPALVERGLRADFALVDGWHTFDHCLVDFFYIDLLLRPGGVIVLDDTWMPGIAAVAEFVLRNRSYALADIVRRASGLRVRLRRAVTGRSRSLPAGTVAVALRKEGDDGRDWFEFAPFRAG